jgi:hypothetical protein
MFEFRIIRDRPRPPQGPVELRLGLRLCLICLIGLPAAATTLACGLVIGDGPTKVDTVDAGHSETSVGTGGTGGSSPSGAGAAAGIASQAGSPPIFDAGSGGTATGSGGVNASGGLPVDGSMPSTPPGGAPGAGGAPAPTCTTDVYWYADEDGDGYGTTESTYTCPKPPGRWALVSGDCDDNQAEVHPQQPKYFGAPYKKPDNTDSFDYDCSGLEEPNPSLTLAPEDCGLLKLALCGSYSGYETNNRVGPGINAWCGSTTIRVCAPMLLLCQTSERSGEPPFSCR